jgi:hypothetical protein
MTRANVPSDEPIRSAITDELDRMREERLSKKSKQSETDEAAVTRKRDLPPNKRP